MPSSLSDYPVGEFPKAAARHPSGISYQSALRSSSVLPNSRITVASPKSPVVGSPSGSGRPR
jgi:hypothetical protein